MRRWGVTISMARVRIWLVFGAALLVLTIAGFLGYARYRTHRFLADLPRRLGVDVRRETNGYTISKSVGPNTTMTLHASKAVEHTDGKLTLHDVSMVLYGRKQDRQDRISGAEFEYDQRTGVVRAAGEVEIDLQAPAHGQSEISQTILPQTGAVGEPDAKGIVHVKTSGLVFLQKLGIAATDQEVDFRLGAMTGRARGAEYNSDTGIVILQSEIEARSEEHGAMVMLQATHAELDRPRLIATVTDARYSSPTQTAHSDRAVVHLRSDSTPERIEADGHVELTGTAGATVTTPHADVLLADSGKAQSAHLFGGVEYTQAGPKRDLRSQGQEARVSFDANGKAQAALMTGKVHLSERTRTTGSAAWAERDAMAERMNFALDAGILREVEANGSAVVKLREATGMSELSGDALRGHFAGTGKTPQLTDLDATGHTGFHRVRSDGAEQTSAGDSLEVVMHGGPLESKALQAVDRATQSGHVILTSKPAPKAGIKQASISRASASLAVYEGSADHMKLSGNAELADEASRVTANTIVLEHGSGDARAEGAVKAIYRQADSAEPVLVVAERAELQHDAMRAVFYGGARPARMWQAGSQVEAPVLEFEQEARTLTAHGEQGTRGAAVHAVLTSAKNEEKPQSVRVASRTMIYLDAERRVDFVGDVLMQDLKGTARADQATGYLQPVGKAKPGVPMIGGVERIVAQGKVEIDQPGRRGSGERLVYTAIDRLFVLTGTPALPPRLLDDTQGLVTGQSLSFHSGDRSVVVAGGAGERVQTVTRVKQR